MTHQLSKVLIIFSTIGIFGCTQSIQKVDLIIEGVSIVDVDRLEIHDDRVVIVNQGVIVSIESNSKGYEAAEAINGNGKYLIPGLWDMHTHYANVKGYEYFNSLFLANGVLGVRDLWGDLAIRDSLQSVDYLMPRKHMSGAIIDGPFTLLEGTLQPKTLDEAVKMVDSLYRKGADFIKVYDDLSRDIYHAIATRCKELGLPFVGHVPLSISATYASEMGQKSIEHLNGIWKSSTTKSSSIDSLELLFKENFLSNNLPGAIHNFTTINSLYTDSYDDVEATNLAKALSKNDTYVTPTLVVIHKHWRRKGGAFLKQEENKYVPEGLLNQWDPELNFPEKMFPPITWEHGKDLFETSLDIVNILQNNKVSIMAGSDCGVSYLVPGFSLHEELNLLVKAGLTNGEALQTATINPAKFLGLSDSLGTIAENKYADLVLLEGNPLEDISNTGKIHAIVKSGKLYSRLQLDSLLSNAVEIAKQKSSNGY